MSKRLDTTRVGKLKFQVYSYRNRVEMPRLVKKIPNPTAAHRADTCSSYPDLYGCVFSRPLSHNRAEAPLADPLTWGTSKLIIAWVLRRNRKKLNRVFENAISMGGGYLLETSYADGF